MKCPKCGSKNIFIQNVQTGSRSTGKIVMREPRKKGCLYWLFCGWFLDLLYFILIGWWSTSLFGTLRDNEVGVEKKEKSIFETRATCQHCGHTWKV